MKIIIPMAGKGERFLSQGINTPKPLIDVCGMPMIEWALKSVEGIPCKDIIFIILAEHEKNYAVSSILEKMTKERPRIIVLDRVTKGQLCTVLAAKEYINTDEDILIHNTDTYLISNIKRDIKNRKKDTAGIISVIKAPGERWSFAKIDHMGRVIEVSEKVRISDYASTGMYYFSEGRQFVSTAEELIKDNETTGGEYYMILAYKRYIEKGLKVTISRADKMWDLGNVESLNKFKEICKKI